MADISHRCCSNPLHAMHHQFILYVQMAHPATLINTNITCFLYIQPGCLKITYTVKPLNCGHPWEGKEYP